MNIASPQTVLSGPFDLLGTVTIGTNNQLPLDSTATLANGGSTTLTAGSQFNRLAVGGAAGQHMGAPLQVLANGTFDELISGSMAFGVLTVSGTNSFGAVSLDGTLDITLLNTFLPEIGQSFTILRFTPNTLTGTFSNIEGQTFNNGTEMWDVVYNNAGGEVDLVAAPNVVPEPSLLVLVGLGLLSIVCARQWHRTSQGCPPPNVDRQT